MDSKTFELVKYKTVENLQNLQAKRYVNWDQWTRSGITTGTGITIIDKVSTEKNYNSIVMNLVSDALESMSSFALGEEELNYTAITTEKEETNSWLKRISINSIIEDIYKTALTYKDAYLQLYTNSEGELDLKVLSPFNVYKKDKDTYFLCEIKEQKEKKVGGFLNKENDTFKITEYSKQLDWKVLVSTYIDTKLESQEVIDMMPFFKLDLDYIYLNKDLFRIQDLINIKLTKIFDIEKYNSDPLTVIKTNLDKLQPESIWFGMSTNTSKQKPVDTTNYEGGAGSIIIVNQDDNVEKIVGSHVDQMFIESLKEMKNDFWKKAQLFGYKNSDITGSVSGVALFWKLTETYSFADKLRGRLKGELLEAFRYFFEQSNQKVLDISEIYLSPLKGEKLKEEEYKKIKIETIKLQSEAIKVLIESGYTRQEAEDYIAKNLI